MNAQLVTVGLPPPILIPAPWPTAVFPMNVQSVTVAALENMYIPPPSMAEFPVIMQLRTVGLPRLISTPPPLWRPDGIPLAPVTVKPSSMAPFASSKTTVFLLPWPLRIVSAGSPLSLCRWMAFARKSTTPL